MERSDTVLECKLIAKLHSSLENDPVIAKYLKFAGLNRNEDYIPRYSDKLLRSSLLAIHESSADNKTTLDLYRRLIAFYYSATFNTVNTLAEVMQIFTKKKIVHIFNDVDNILCSWDTFIRSALLPLLFKETFLEIMKEWAKRYEFVYVRQLERVEEQARKVLTYLCWDLKYMQPWLETFNNTNLPEAQYQYTTEQQLEINVIIHDIRDSLNPLIPVYVLSSLPLNAVDTLPTLPFWPTSLQQDSSYNEMMVKEEYTETNVAHSIEIAAHTNENELNIGSFVHNERQRYDERFSADDNYFHEYDNSITAFSATNNEFHEESQPSEFFVINEFDMGEEGNNYNDSKSKRGIQKATALRYLEELRLYALQTGLVQIIEKLNEIGTIIRLTRAKSFADRAREFRQRKKQRQQLVLWEEYVAARDAHSPATISSRIAPTERSWNKKSISSTPKDNTVTAANAENCGNNKKKLHNADFPTTMTGMKKPKKSNAARMREYRARKKLRKQQAELFNSVQAYVADADTVDLTATNWGSSCDRTYGRTQYNNEVDESVKFLDDGQSDDGLTLCENEDMPQDVFDVRSMTVESSTLQGSSIQKRGKHEVSVEEEQITYDLLIPKTTKSCTERTRECRIKYLHPISQQAKADKKSRSSTERVRAHRARKKLDAMPKRYRTQRYTVKTQDDDA